METTTTESAHEGWLTVGKVAKVLLWVVYAWLVVNLVILALAFILQLFGASPSASFVEWVYRSASRTMAPLRGMFDPVPLSGQSVLDTTLLFAMIIYGLAALALRAAIDWLTRLITRSAAPAPRPDRLPPPRPTAPGAV